MKTTKIEGINNYYGSLYVKKKFGRYYMDVKCEIYGYKWREIKKELYDMLLELNKK